jgi:hypothetical protein
LRLEKWKSEKTEFAEESEGLDLEVASVAKVNRLGVEGVPPSFWGKCRAQGKLDPLLKCQSLVAATTGRML